MVHGQGAESGQLTGGGQVRWLMAKDLLTLSESESDFAVTWYGFPGLNPYNPSNHFRFRSNRSRVV